MAFGLDPRSCYRATKAVKDAFGGRVIVKLTPNAADITAVARAAVEGGADALSLINTLLGMAIDIRTRKPLLGNVTGGLSGPAIKPVALRCVYQVAQAVNVPIMGIGGNFVERLEFMLDGAEASPEFSLSTRCCKKIAGDIQASAARRRIRLERH